MKPLFMTILTSLALFGCATRQVSQEIVNLTTTEEWYSYHIENLMAYEASDKTSEIEFSTYAPENSGRPDAGYSHCASGDGLFRFDESNWVVLLTHSSHYEPVGNAVLLMDQDRNFFTISCHPCKHLEVYTADPLEINSLSNLLMTTSLHGDKWIKIDPYQSSEL